MSDSVDGSDRTGDGRHDGPKAEGTIESYESEERIVLYDSENPSAWMETTQSVQLEEFV